MWTINYFFTPWLIDFLSIVICKKNDCFNFYTIPFQGSAMSDGKNKPPLPIIEMISSSHTTKDVAISLLQFMTVVRKIEQRVVLKV